MLTLKNARDVAPPMLLNIGLHRQRQQLAYRPRPASDRTPRSLQHARRKVVVGVRGSRTTEKKIRHTYLYEMQRRQGGRFSDGCWYFVKNRAERSFLRI